MNTRAVEAYYRAQTCTTVAGLRPAPHRGQPRLLVAWKASRPIVMLEFYKACQLKVALPMLQVMVGPVAPAVPALAVITRG